MQGVPITKNVREKFYEKNLTYVFDYVRDRFFEFNFTIRLAKIGEVTLARFSNKFSLHFLESFQRKGTPFSCWWKSRDSQGV